MSKGVWVAAAVLLVGIIWALVTSPVGPSIAMRDLGRVAAGLNIEGGYPARDLWRSQPDGIWIGLVVTLDRPLVDNVTFDEIKASKVRNKWPFLENAVPEINEQLLTKAYFTVLGFAMTRAETLTVHVHQFPEDARPWIGVLQKFATNLRRDPRFQGKVKTTRIEWMTDEPMYKLGRNYTTDWLLSLSQCAGLSDQLPPGSLLVPSRFIPYDTAHNYVRIKGQYFVRNGLVDMVDDMLADPIAEYVERVHSIHYSANPSKLHHQQPSPRLTADHFLVNATILQVSGLWNPTNPSERVWLL